MENNNFNELLLHTLKQLGIRLDRVVAKLDQKIYKADFRRLEEKLDATNEVLKAQTERLARIEGRLKTTLCVLSVEIVLVGIIVAFL